jgi:hypothetical protein
MSPSDVDKLTLAEFEQLTTELDAYIEAMKKGT